MSTDDGDESEANQICKGKLKNGEPCTSKAKTHGFCGRHQKQKDAVVHTPPQTTTSTVTHFPSTEQEINLLHQLNVDVQTTHQKQERATYQYIEVKKPKRPDVAERMKARKSKVETVVKTALLGRLGCELDETTRLCLYDEINQWVFSTSKVTHRLSLMFNRLLLHLLSNDLELPEFKDALFTGLALAGIKCGQQQEEEGESINKKKPSKPKQSKQTFSTLIEDFQKNEFGKQHFPHISRQRGDCQAITIAALRYKTNFLNSLFVPFYQRQSAFVKVWCLVNEIQDVTVRDITWAINGWKPEGYRCPTFPVCVQGLISEHRNLLGNANNISETWLKKNPALVLKYYYNILRFYTAVDMGKKFTLAPLSKIKCHFLTIDKTVLRELLNNVRKRTDNFPPELSVAIDGKSDNGTHPMENDQVWKKVFNFDGLRRKRKFGYQVDTDGVSICFHFNTTLRRKKKGDKRRRLKRRRYQKVIAIDPGRSNIITAYDTSNESYYRLTRQQYYRCSGMKRRVARQHLRRIPLQGVYQAMSNAPVRSIRGADWFRYQEIVAKHYDRLWEIHGSLASRREAFRVFCLKQKCLDKFFNKFITNGIKPIIAYGAASVNPTGKGELSVPVKHVYNKCCQRFRTEKENEDYTTKMHVKCRQITTPVMNTKTNLVIRGLRWCPTCRELVSRDRNACKNIATSFLSETRPTYLCRTTHLRNNRAGELPARRLAPSGGRAPRGVSSNRYPYNSYLLRLLQRQQLESFFEKVRVEKKVARLEEVSQLASSAPM